MLDLLRVYTDAEPKAESQTMMADHWFLMLKGHGYKQDGLVPLLEIVVLHDCDFVVNLAVRVLFHVSVRLDLRVVVSDQRELPM